MAVGVSLLCAASLFNRSFPGPERIDPRQYLVISSTTAAAWTLVPGVGPRTADSLDALRRAGVFSPQVTEPDGATARQDDAIRDLETAPGVGPQTLRRMRPYLAPHRGVDH